jgi:hypothetical protein
LSSASAVPYNGMILATPEQGVSSLHLRSKTEEKNNNNNNNITG